MWKTTNKGDISPSCCIFALSFILNYALFTQVLLNLQEYGWVVIVAYTEY